MTGFQKWLRAHRPFCVCYECARFALHKLLFFVPQRTPVWYGFNKRPSSGKKETLPLDESWYHIRRPLYLHEHVYYNLDNALAANPNIKGFAFVFFMGIGDYLYTTPVLSALKQKYPHIPFYGYVGAQFDRNNSPLVGKLLEANPHFEKVFYFQGARHPLIWKNYDYSAVLQEVPEGFLILPVYYDYSQYVTHRVVSLFETFNLPVPLEVPTPQLDFPVDVAQPVADYLAVARAQAQCTKGVVFLQLDSRGSSYTYPYVKDLAEKLIRAGYFVMSVTPGGPIQNPQYLQVDIKKLAIHQTWQLLHLIKQEFPTYVIAVNSVFWAASAGLQLPNLGLQHWVDKKVHNLWYPNIEVVTNHLYSFLPREKQILAPAQSYTPHNHKIVDYKPDWIVRWFTQKFGE